MATAALLEFLNAAEAGIMQAKRLIAQAKGVEQWDPCKIKWEQAEGNSGPYERSEDVNNTEFKGMLQDLAAHGGKITRNGYFYWIFKNGATVGRKKRGKQGSKASETKLEAGFDPAEFFPEDLRSLLSFEKRADAYIIKPRQFLGSENFAKILAIVTECNGEYVSQGKQSHFKIPIKSS